MQFHLLGAEKLRAQRGLGLEVDGNNRGGQLAGPGAQARPAAEHPRSSVHGGSCQTDGLLAATVRHHHPRERDDRAPVHADALAHVLDHFRQQLKPAVPITGHANATNGGRQDFNQETKRALSSACVTSARGEFHPCRTFVTTPPCCIQVPRWWAVQGSNL
ncbi:hypothetical protein [Luteimonas sp. 3794]|uniref:hypothetical protein n=1 Tax=Luteimonas sp. 3794 TaxID=2817730 RepID=UPI00286C824D|nr:hypothetical protein [Luteimonas sp. 3794]